MTDKGKGAEKGKPLSAKTKANIRGVLHKALKQAKAIKIIPENPADADGLTYQKIKIKPYESIEDDDMVKLIDAIQEDTQYKRIMLIYLLLGLRECEAIGLTWKKVHLNSETPFLIVDMQLAWSKRKKCREYRTTKEDDTRKLYLSDTVIALLREEKAEQDKHKREVKEAGGTWKDNLDLVFTKEDGAPFCQVTVYKHFKDAAAKAGIPETRVHDLRHQYATKLLEGGVDLDTTSKNMGHTDPAFTMKRYINSTQRARMESAAAVDSYAAKIGAAKQEKIAEN